MYTYTFCVFTCHLPAFIIEKKTPKNSNITLPFSAIYGYGFCQAARKAFRIIVSNALRLAAINSVGDFVLFLGKVVTVSAVTVIGIQMMSVSYAIKTGSFHDILLFLPVAKEVRLKCYFISHM